MRWIAVCFILLTGCAQTVWTKPGLSEQEFLTDAYACERDMRQSGYYGYGLAGAIAAYDFQERCMRSKGYYKVPADSVQRIYRR